MGADEDSSQVARAAREDWMQGRSKFSRQEAAEIKQIFREKATADRSRQKVLRGRLRSKYRFYITDFRSDAAGFTA